MSMCSCLQSSLSWTKPCISANNKKCKKKPPNKYEILDFVYRINEIQKKSTCTHNRSNQLFIEQIKIKQQQ